MFFQRIFYTHPKLSFEKELFQYHTMNVTYFVKFNDLRAKNDRNVC